MDWNDILNWRLLSGSHRFPGPDGGTCINEAAIVAAGFQYKEVSSANDCPPCFSRVIAGYAIRLNDSMSDNMRQELLMPFVTRLAGTADRPSVEIARATYIAIQTIRRILPISLRTAKLEKEAAACERAETLEAAANAVYAANATNATNAVYAATNATNATNAVYAVYAATNAATNAVYAAANAVYAATNATNATNAVYAANAAANAINAAANAVYAAANAAANAVYAAANAVYAANARKEVFTIAVEILDGAIRLGNQADPIDMAVVASRMENVRQRALVDVP